MKIVRSRKFAYTMVGLLVLGVNLNVMYPAIAQSVQHTFSHLQSQKEKYGVWDINTKEMPVNAIHAVLLHTGKVLVIAGSGNNQKNFDTGTFNSVLWDPKANTFTEVDTPWDAFCAGHAFLPDGKVLVAGGTKDYEDLEVQPKKDYAGLKLSYVFNPDTEKYERVDAMNYARWYPTLVGLPNGNVLASSGLDEKGKVVNGHTEIFDHDHGHWVERGDLNRVFPTYPALFLTGDGKLFFSGSNSGYGSSTQGRQPGIWDLSNNTFQEIGGLEDPTMTETSASVLLPPAQDQRFMILGGGGIGDSPEATSRTAIVDLTNPNPLYESGPDLAAPTRYSGAVILPDDTVLQTGGSSGYRQDDLLITQIFNPRTNSFSKAASPLVGRNYHSEALLLPDGRVATFGSNPIDNSFELRIEIYSPAYLFQNISRPVVTGGTSEYTRGGTYNVRVRSNTPVKTAKLIRPSAVTHTTDVEQRSVKLEFKEAADGIEVSVPGNVNLLPSGWYMLFVTDQNDIPSEARWVHVK
jgi:hypothetical protein